MERNLSSIATPTPHQGFLGPGHEARAVLLNNFSETDPFIALMDDRIVVPEGKPVGGPHPHAGFETVTLVLEGSLGDEQHGYRAGDFEMMTAGKGVIHTESIEPGTRVHILQLWLTLPKSQRWAMPRIQRMKSNDVPAETRNGTAIKVYSGSFAGITSPVENHVPVTIALLTLDPSATLNSSLPSAYNGFVYVIEGEVTVGSQGQKLVKDQVGWFDRPITEGESSVNIATTVGAQLVLYVGAPQRDPIVSYGPFIGDTQRDIIRLYEEYHQGLMKHVSTLPADQVLTY